MATFAFWLLVLAAAYGAATYFDDESHGNVRRDPDDDADDA
jgi:hypothetical protein